MKEIKEMNRKEPKVDDKIDEKDEKDKKILELTARVTELTETLQRLQADSENYRKYVEKQKLEFFKYAKEDLIVKLLPVLDSFEMALKNVEDKEKFVSGIKLIFSQLYQSLENEGLKPINALREKFDPYKHEVLLSQECNKEDDIILEELQRGYTIGDKVIRHSKVKIARKKFNN